jgi:hypothetical protein
MIYGVPSFFGTPSVRHVIADEERRVKIDAVAHRRPEGDGKCVRKFGRESARRDSGLTIVALR